MTFDKRHRHGSILGNRDRAIKRWSARSAARIFDNGDDLLQRHGAYHLRVFWLNFCRLNPIGSRRYHLVKWWHTFRFLVGISSLLNASSTPRSRSPWDGITGTTGLSFFPASCPLLPSSSTSGQRSVPFILHFPLLSVLIQLQKTFVEREQFGLDFNLSRGLCGH